MSWQSWLWIVLIVVSTAECIRQHRLLEKEFATADEQFRLIAQEFATADEPMVLVVNREPTEGDDVTDQPTA